MWNAEIDRRPAVIARCASAADVAAAIGFARGSGLEISVRGGAHNSAGTAVCDDGLMLDLSLLNEVTVDPAARRARAGGGALLADLDAATQAHGLAVPAGLISHTGIGGLTLGGGMGWLTRQFGLTIDNLVSAEVVTAAGQVLRAAHDEHPGLFWALRGGGGNFGVVTSFEFRLHEVDPMVRFGFFFWGLDQGPEVLRLAREIVAALPPDISAVIGAVNAPPAPFVPSRHHFAPGYALLLAGFGSGPDHARLATEIGQRLPPVADLVTTLPYVELQQMLDEANAWGAHCYEKGMYVEDLTDPVIDVLTEHVPRKSSAMSSLLLYRLDGAYSRRRGRDRLRRRPLAALRCVHRRLRAGPAGWTPIAAGSGSSGRRCARRPSAAALGTSTPRPSTRGTGSAPATARPSTNGWPRSRPRTTRATCSTSTPTSHPPEACALRRSGRGGRAGQAELDGQRGVVPVDPLRADTPALEADDRDGLHLGPPVGRAHPGQQPRQLPVVRERHRRLSTRWNRSTVRDIRVRTRSPGMCGRNSSA